MVSAWCSREDLEGHREAAGWPGLSPSRSSVGRMLPSSALQVVSQNGAMATELCGVSLGRVHILMLTFAWRAREYSHEHEDEWMSKSYTHLLVAGFTTDGRKEQSRARRAQVGRLSMWPEAPYGICWKFATWRAGERGGYTIAYLYRYYSSRQHYR